MRGKRVYCGYGKMGWENSRSNGGEKIYMVRLGGGGRVVGGRVVGGGVWK